MLAPIEGETRGPFLALVAALALVLVLPYILPTLRSIMRS
jgi:flagellar biogenesis protein FliO